MGDDLIGRLETAAQAPHQMEYSDLGALLKEAADRVRFLVSVAGAVNKGPSPVEAAHRQSAKGAPA